MLVIVDVFFTVAVIAVAAAAIPELQLRVTHICPAAHRTPMGVVFGVLLGCCIRPGLRTGELNSPCFFRGFLFGKLYSPGYREDVDKIMSKEQEKIQNGDKGE